MRRISLLLAEQKPAQVLCQDDIPARTTNEDEAQAKATCGHSFHK